MKELIPAALLLARVCLTFIDIAVVFGASVTSDVDVIPADNNDNKNDLAERRLMTMTAIFDCCSILGKLRRGKILQI